MSVQVIGNIVVIALIAFAFGATASNAWHVFLDNKYRKRDEEKAFKQELITTLKKEIRGMSTKDELIEKANQYHHDAGFDEGYEQRAQEDEEAMAALLKENKRLAELCEFMYSELENYEQPFHPYHGMMKALGLLEEGK